MPAPPPPAAGIAGSGVLGDTPAAFFAVGVDAAKAALARKDAAAPSQIDFLRLLAPTCSGVTCAALRKALAALGGGGATSGDDGPVTPGPVVPPPVPSNASVCNNGLCLLGVPGEAAAAMHACLLGGRSCHLPASLPIP